MRKIAVLTSGGDAPGMNAAIRAVVRYATKMEMEVYGVERGYEGLLTGNLTRMDTRSVSDTIHRGGTILKTARCLEFVKPEGVAKAAEVLRAFGIEGLIVIGGDGSYRGLKDLLLLQNFPVVGIPGTIDNDLAYTDYTLGFDTAVNTVISAVNNIRDTMSSHDRACIIEVMGRHCGDIAVYAGLAGGCEEMLVPEIPYDIDKLCSNIKNNMIKGKISTIILLAEGVCPCTDLKKEIQSKIDITMRTVKLGYIQRGGTPSMADRILAARCGARAVELLKNDVTTGRVVGIRENKIIDVDLVEALDMPRRFDEELYMIAHSLAQ